MLRANPSETIPPRARLAHSLAHRSPRHATVVAYAALFVALSGGAYAVVRPSAGSGTISLCLKKKGGTLRTVRSKAHCHRGETKLVWNKQGRPGVRGATGAPGPTGATGPAGSDFKSKRVVRVSQVDPAPVQIPIDEAGLHVTMSCSSSSVNVSVGTQAIGDRGTTFDAPLGSPTAVENRAIDDGGSASSSSGVGNNGRSGWATVRRPDGTVTRLDFELRYLPDGFGTADDCFFDGFLRTTR